MEVKNQSSRRKVPLDPKFAESLKLLRQKHLKDTFKQRYGRNDFLNNDIALTRRHTSFNELRKEVRMIRSSQETFKDLRDMVNRNNHFTTESDLITYRKSRRFQIIAQIENIMLEVLQDISEGKYPKFELRNQKLWSNCVFENNVSLKNIDDAKMRTVSYSSNLSKIKFTVILHMLMEIHQLLTKGLTCTKRELYYQNINRVKSQEYVDCVIRDICCILNCPQWEMGILATSKGLVAGPLILSFFNSNNVLNCSEAGGVLIPQDVLCIKSASSNAQFILVIEKDAIFQKLLDEEAVNRLGSCILITGKGYPDINTRLFLKFLVDCLKIPAFALVDADPHGIEIMCTYRYGSLGMSHLADKLAVPSLRWLGVLPTDIYQLDTPSIELTKLDISKAEDLLTRPFMESNNELKNQVVKMLEMNKKTEIEGVATLSQAYLTDGYIPHKICSKNLI